MGKRGKQPWSKKSLPVGTVKLRTRDGGRSVRMIRIRTDGPRSRQWVNFARWSWELAYGPIPAGQRVVHADGNSLHDTLSNYVLMGPGEVIRLFHRLRPEMSEENRRGRKRLDAMRDHNRLRGQIRRARLLPRCWYAVDHAARIVVGIPYKSRSQLYRDRGCQVPRNGVLPASVPIVALRGADAAMLLLRGYERSGDSPMVRADRCRADCSPPRALEV